MLSSVSLKNLYVLLCCLTKHETNSKIQARLAINSVTLGDYNRPLQISQFIKDIFSGFQILNLKNDTLRRRSDGIKYSVKKVEDVVYDLSLRNLLPKTNASTMSSRSKDGSSEDAMIVDGREESPAKKVKT